MNDDVLYESSIPNLPLLARGKVRDIYSVDDRHLLIVTTDRLSAYDVILPDPIPGKGEVLTKISLFWFRMMEDIIDNQLTDLSVDDVVDDKSLCNRLRNRSLVVKRLKPLPIESVVRGYLIGSGWRDYLESGQVCGISLPKGMKQAEKLPRTLFTPATKAAAGDHDENISFEKVVELIGERLATRVRDVSIKIYERAAAYALARGIIIADTKFEFGLDEEGRLHFIDEALTPDSSRFWPVAEYQVGTSPPSFDKQFVRDYLDTLDWDKTAPGPELPDAVLSRTAEKYAEALRRMTR
ncbi:MAG: phosphoribosylaminoimidazolesuccinocarboxamide synthase [Gammaproteobacteria bacterium]|nr:phosphoribosylaminoimidazolesuccinocarboxamide synthase [Gammaproteobacteria bacterium]MDH5239864.1 phosphoribosylaminoimidazolesuccinocarboxamide synthase [Gammaproteobacteria bacterium]MDH5262999.1 phosphoribosylaminoimidazolesuccinocarboxamide synthase [Gammaproteobacteria bacterium]MDH5582952.1 phosphoribosylaminoimidazolesuccinocarboxamide synthase [Gammaproteobacteria bacterium]